MSSISGEFYNEKRYQRVRGCSGKRRFESWEQAGKECVRMFESKAEILAPYFCTHCSGYHNGHNAHDIKAFFTKRLEELSSALDARAETIREQRSKLKEIGGELQFRRQMRDHCQVCRWLENLRRLVL